MEREQSHEQVFERYSRYEPQVAQGLTLSLPRFGRGSERGTYATEGGEYAKSGQAQTLLQPEVFTRLLLLTQPSLFPESTAESVKKTDKIVLTERERSILAGVARGERSKEIAAHLGITAATVAAHLTNIYAKLGADLRASAVAIAMRRGLLPLNEEEGS